MNKKQYFFLSNLDAFFSLSLFLKGAYEKPTAILILSDKRLSCFPLELEIVQGCLSTPISIYHCSGGSSQ